MEYDQVSAAIEDLTERALDWMAAVFCTEGAQPDAAADAEASEEAATVADEQPQTEPLTA